MVLVRSMRDGIEGSRCTDRNEGPRADEGGEQLPATDIDVLWRKGHEVVGGADGVRGDVDAERDDDEADGSKGSGGAATVGACFQPFTDNVDGVPHHLAVGGFGGSGGENTQQADDGCSFMVSAGLPMGKQGCLLKMNGMTMAWMFCALGLLAYLEKSAMLRPNVA